MLRRRLLGIGECARRRPHFNAGGDVEPFFGQQRCVVFQILLGRLHSAPNEFWGDAAQLRGVVEPGYLRDNADERDRQVAHAGDAPDVRKSELRYTRSV